ncbi:MAG TPA: hypothetical protein VNE62_02795 [Actinomycetota bacterium]|nr:hypothetical protein [Actinomycetota bacterium]
MIENPIGGLLFLVAGVGLFVGCIVLLALRDQRRRRTKETVAHFQRTKGALGKIFVHQATLKEASWRKARRDHPASSPAAAPARQPAPAPPAEPAAPSREHRDHVATPPPGGAARRSSGTPKAKRRAGRTVAHRDRNHA